MQLFRKLLVILLLLISSSAWASAPSRGPSYVAGTTISSTAVNSDFNLLYNYLIAGVDTYAAGSLTDAAVSSSANIQSSKLSLSSIAQNISNTGTFANIGAMTITGALNVSTTAIITGGINSTAIGASTPSTGAFTTLSSTGTTSLGNTTLTGTLNLGSTHQGDVLYDNGTSIIRLVPGTSGQFLQTQGASANPQWATVTTPALSLLSTTTVAGAASTGNITLTSGKAYKIIVKGSVATNNDTVFLRFDTDSGANYAYIKGGYSGGANVVNARTTGAAQIVTSTAMTNGVSFEITMDFLANFDSVNNKDVIGSIRYTDGSGISVSNFVANYVGAASITSFVLLASTGNISATVWTYEYSGT